MTTKFPVVSLNIMRQLFPDNTLEAEEIASNGLWFYSVPDSQFLSYIPNINLCVNDVQPVHPELTEEDVKFNMRTYGSVYEVTVKGNFPSSFLLSSNIYEMTEQYLDVTEDLHVVVLNSITTPIMLGSKKALSRLLIASDEDSYKMFSLQQFVRERG